MFVNIDFQGSNEMAKNDLSEIRAKHFGNEYPFVGTQLQERKFKMNYCTTNNMVADTLTNPLGNILLERFRGYLGLMMVI